MDKLSLYRRGGYGHINSSTKVGSNPSILDQNSALGYKSELSVDRMGQFMLSNEGCIFWIGKMSKACDNPYDWSPAMVIGIEDEAIIAADVKFHPIVAIDVSNRGVQK